MKPAAIIDELEGLRTPTRIESEHLRGFLERRASLIDALVLAMRRDLLTGDDRRRLRRLFDDGDALLKAIQVRQRSLAADIDKAQLARRRLQDRMLVDQSRGVDLDISA